ncbi:hypothetical protein QBC44DRAFT_314046 [Cladorrhinum sp. PSN332]|nr:hypothetical protein QBC44DRAFT_314046 [Cladorrhinum sp. PSN332]
MSKLYYFQAPTFVINPDSPVAPKLGSIFSKSGLDRLAAPLNQDNVLYVPENTINQSGPFPFEERVSKSLAVTLGVSAKAVLLGEGNILYHFARSRNVTYRADGLETVEFEPGDEFVRDSVVASRKVQEFLDASLAGRKKVYMVTGLKIATGFSQVRAEGVAHGPEVGVSVDAGLVGVPGIEAGPQGQLEFETERVVVQGAAGGNKIVFAYRVVVVRRKRDGEVTFEWKSGGKYGVGDDDDDDDDDDEEEEDDDAKNACVVADIDDEMVALEGPEGFFGDVSVSS